MYSVFLKLSSLFEHIQAMKQDILKIHDGILVLDNKKIVLRLFINSEVNVDICKLRAYIKYKSVSDEEDKYTEINEEILNKTIKIGNQQIEFIYESPNMSSKHIVFEKLDLWIKKVRFRIKAATEISTSPDDPNLSNARINNGQLYFCSCIQNLENMMTSYLQKLTIDTKKPETSTAPLCHALIPNIQNPCYTVIELCSHKGSFDLEINVTCSNKIFYIENFVFYSLETGKQIPTAETTHSQTLSVFKLSDFSDQKILVYFEIVPLVSF